MLSYDPRDKIITSKSGSWLDATAYKSTKNPFYDSIVPCMHEIIQSNGPGANAEIGQLDLFQSRQTDEKKLTRLNCNAMDISHYRRAEPVQIYIFNDETF